MPIKHLVMFSGGVGSWAAAKRVVERNGKDGVALLFADTLYEDADLYRFIDEASGIDWSEKHRLTRLQERIPKWRYEAPMCDRPCLTKSGMLHWLESEGIRPPRLYSLGFPHNNCGGFCVKAGQAQFRLLLNKLPEVYAENERQEEQIRELLGDVSVMRSRVGGESKPITMKTFRQRIEREPNLFAEDEDWGGCGCAIDDGETKEPTCQAE